MLYLEYAIFLVDIFDKEHDSIVTHFGKITCKIYTFVKINSSTIQ